MSEPDQQYSKRLSFHATAFDDEQIRLVAANEGLGLSDALRAALRLYVEGKLSAVPTRRVVTDGVQYRLDELEKHILARIGQFEQASTAKLAQATHKIIEDLSVEMGAALQVALYPEPSQENGHE